MAHTQENKQAVQCSNCTQIESMRLYQRVTVSHDGGKSDLYQHYQHQLSKSGGRQFQICVQESRRLYAEIEDLDQEDVWSREIFRKILIKRLVQKNLTELIICFKELQLQKIN